MADLVAMDLVPEPTILAAALRACRRVNDYSLTTRILEITKIKCADNEAEFWPYIMQVTIIQLQKLGNHCVGYFLDHFGQISLSHWLIRNSAPFFVWSVWCCFCQSD